MYLLKNFKLLNFINASRDHSNGYFGISGQSLAVSVGQDSLIASRRCVGRLDAEIFHGSTTAGTACFGPITTAASDMKSISWYTNTFLLKMKSMKKSPLVFTKQTLAADAADTIIAK